MAVEIAMHSGSTEDVVRELGERIGSGPAIAETVPMALGILVANQGDTMQSIYDAVNIGDETSAIACIVGAIAGTYHGDVYKRQVQVRLTCRLEQPSVFLA